MSEIQEDKPTQPVESNSIIKRLETVTTSTELSGVVNVINEAFDVSNWLKNQTSSVRNRDALDVYNDALTFLKFAECNLDIETRECLYDPWTDA